MKSNKGFTLIEVLTVIVVLAIIALIAVPVIMGIVGKAQKSAFKDSAYELVKAGDLLYSTNEMEGAILERKTFTFPSDTKDLDVKGELPTGGKMVVYENGEVAMAVTNDKYCATKKYGSKEVVVTEDTENCELKVFEIGDAIYFDPTLGEKGMLCTEGDYITKNSKTGHKDGCMKWYVYNTKNNESKLILDHNTTDKVAWLSSNDYEALDPTKTSNMNSHNPITLMRQLEKDTKNWKLKADIIDVQDLLNLLSWYQNLDDKSIWENKYMVDMQAVFGEIQSGIVKNEYQTGLDASKELTNELLKHSSGVGLPKYLHEDLYSNCTVEEGKVICSTYGYWTKNANSTGSVSAWTVSNEGIVNSLGVDSDIASGVRPIITITQ